MNQESADLRVAGLFLKDRLLPGNRLSRFATGLLPYRADLLRDKSTNLRVLDHAWHPAHRKVRDVVEHRGGFAVDTQLRSWRTVRSADVVLAVLEPEATLPSLMKQRSLPPYRKKPIVVLSCWWGEELLHGTGERKARILQIIEGVDKVIVLSRNQLEVFQAAGVPAEKVVAVGFGVDTDFYSPSVGQEKRFEVLAAGVDRGRDFETLIEAAKLIPDVRMDIFTQPGRFGSLPIPPNVTVHGRVTAEEHRENLRGAELVVVPTHDLAYPTGQSVLLEASACGSAVAVTSTAAMAEYIRDRETAFALPLHDAEGMAAVIGSAMQDDRLRRDVAQRGRDAVLAEFNFAAMWSSVRQVLVEVVDQGRIRT